ncbi:MAG: hypothetical protein HKM02_06410 [Pseudomonadales bacterium]|nr:hypothetical protein [Pseudomonadales bacterium]
MGVNELKQFLLVQETQKLVPPPKRLVDRKTQALSHLTNRQPISHAGSILQEFFFFTQPAQWASRQSHEGLGATTTQKSLCPTRGAILNYLGISAMRTAALFCHSSHHQSGYPITVLAWLQNIGKLIHLLVGQSFNMRNPLFVVDFFHVDDSWVRHNYT